MAKTRAVKLNPPTRPIIPRVVPRENKVDAEAIAGLRDFCERAGEERLQLHPATMLAVIEYVERQQADADRWRHMQHRLRVREHKSDDTGYWLHLVPIEVNHFLFARKDGAPRDVNEAVDALRGAIDIAKVRG